MNDYSAPKNTLKNDIKKITSAVRNVPTNAMMANINIAKVKMITKNSAQIIAFTYIMPKPAITV